MGKKTMKRTKTPKTTGIEWLYHSMSSFNGSGYADKSTPENYVASYRAYKQWKKQPEAIRLVDENLDVAFELACELCNAREAGHKPSDKNYQLYRQFYNPDKISLFQ